MCGIVGGIGNIAYREYLIEGLKKLDYRGYDSAGLSFMKNGEIKTFKVLGKVSALDQIVPEFEADAGIAHTRWATHGQPSVVNAHPHTSNSGLFTIVHNGVIENYRAIRNQLKARKFHFESATDTEVIANLLERLYIRCGSVLEALREAEEILEGSYACAILCKERPHRLYFMKKASPLLIGAGKEAYYLASDAVPMIQFTNKFVELEDLSYGYVEKEKIRIYKNNEKVEPVFVERNVDQFVYDKGDNEHFMLKEIKEIPQILRSLVDNYFDGKKYTFSPEMIAALRKTKRVHFLACGTSFYASKMGVRYFRYLGKEAIASIASEWGYDPYDVSENQIYILLSQSGETADLIRCLKVINARGGISIAVTNSKGSTIDRNSTYSILLYCGLEVAVASTKSYLAQTVAIAMLVGCLERKTKCIVHLDKLIESCHDILNRSDEIRAIAKECTYAQNAFFVGRTFDYNACLEGALKLKEITYIHAEAYPGGELKHGPIALIENNTLVIGFVSDPAVALATRNNFEELRARNANVVIFSSESVAAKGDKFVVKDVKPYLTSLGLVMVVQLLTYYIALEKGLPIDKPRNLAKSVTVE